MLQNIGHCQYLPMFCNTLYQCVRFLAYSRDPLVFISNGDDDNDLDPDDHDSCQGYPRVSLRTSISSITAAVIEALRYLPSWLIVS